MTIHVSVKHIVLHELTQSEGGELHLHLNGGNTHQGVNTDLLVQQMHNLFIAKSGKGYGFFSQHASSDVARYALDHLVRGDTSFLSITTKLAESLHQALMQYPLAEAGVLVFAEYQSRDGHYVMLGLVPKTPSLTTSDNLDVASVDALDVTHMAIAARIDIQAMIDSAIGDEGRYVSFLRTGSKRKMNDFFIDSMGLELAAETKLHNQVLAQALEDFLTDANVGEEARTMLERTAYAYCDGQIRLKDDLSIAELSEAISEEFEHSFEDYVKENGYGLEDEFPGDRSALRRLVKVFGTGGGLSLSFDAQLLNHRVFYDGDTDSLTIKGLPPSMRDQLIRRPNTPSDTH